MVASPEPEAPAESEDYRRGWADGHREALAEVLDGQLHAPAPSSLEP